MNDRIKKQIDEKQDEYRFIKVTDMPVSGLSDSQKVALNRKANALFNDGKLDMAERIFITTGYSDGLSRIADKYLEKNDYIKALKLYFLAHNKRKSEPVVEKISQVMSLMIKSNS